MLYIRMGDDMNKSFVEIVNVITDKNNNKSYNIYIGNNLLDSIEEYITFPKNLLIITDTNIPFSYSEKIKVKANNCYIYRIKPGENSKTVNTYIEILTLMMEKSFSRSDLVIGLGGGVVGDLAGFVASTYKRGVDFINIPTSTLSMIDSSIGGKVAVNLDNVKNIVGSFYMPKKVIISLDTLSSLPRRQYYNGLIEALKAGLIYDKALFQMFKDNFDELESQTVLKEVILKSINVKKSVVEVDPYEKGLRKILNFGHTIGHAIESENFDKIFHGEAVLLGMMYFCSQEIKKDLELIKEKIDLINETALKNVNINSKNAYQLLCNDKKRKDDYIDVIYVEEVGKAIIKKVSLSELKLLIEGK